MRRLLSEGSASDVSSPLFPISADLSGSAAIIAPARRHRGLAGKFKTEKRRAVQLTDGSLGVEYDDSKEATQYSRGELRLPGRAPLLHLLVVEEETGRCRGMEADTPVVQAQTLSL